MKKLMCFRFLCCLVIACISTAGCSAGFTSPAPSSQIPQTAVNVDLGFKKKIVRSANIEETFPMAQPGGGFGFQLFDENGKTYTENIINSGEDTDYFLTFYSYIPNKESYKLMQFVDFHQKPISVDEKEYSSGFDFNMPPNGIIDIPLSVHGLKPGLHEILYVFVVSSSNKSLDEESRTKLKRNNLKFCRIFISVNGSTEPALDIQYETPGFTKNQGDIDAILLNRDKDSWFVWLSDKAKPNETIPCYLHIGTGSKEQKERYAVILLNEWKQAEISKGKDVLFLELEAKKEAIIETQLTMPAAEGIYDVTPILVPSPYNVLLIERPLTSCRTGIKVANGTK